MATWWERFPGRLEAELDDFRALGLEFERDEAMFRDAGRLLLRGSIEYEGERFELEVLYPDLFPYVRPEVFAPGLALGRHQNPVLHNLCLLEGATRAWKPHETGAWLVSARVPLLLGLIRSSPEEMAAAEVPQGEPLSVYFKARGQPGTVVFVPAQALSLDPEQRVGSGRISFSPDSPADLAVRGLLCELVARTGAGKKTKLLARAEEQLTNRFGGERIQMRWARLDALPDEFTPEALLTAAEEVQPGFGRPPWQRVANGEIGVTGIVFPEEVRQGTIEDAWLFVVRWRRVTAAGSAEGSYVIPGERLSPDDLGARIPRLASLREATLAQVGLGALGAPLALELARNQVAKLRLLEDDYLEAAQIVRWPFGLQAVGRLKLNALAGFIEQNYPYTEVERFLHRLGGTGFERQARSENELDLLDRFIDGATLVIDASAEPRIQQLIADRGSVLGVRQLFVSATEGARGGQVALIVPGAGGCWFCWKLHTQADNDGKPAIELPPYEPGATVQPRGCAFPTFTGASFDLLPLTAQAARAAAAAVQRESGVESTVWVCSVPADGVEPPEWQTFPVAVHPECPLCASGG
jgi:molybdopterin/thiamine biosynthesis adenylyltransferase